ncbi:MAG TPA: hypothetical protein VF624_11345 [Tepidisphaeraceae bacterium]
MNDRFYQTLEPRKLMAGSYVATDGDGTRVTVELVGHGRVFGNLVDGRLYVSVKDTRGKARLSITAKGGDGRIVWGGTNATDALKSVAAPEAIVTGKHLYRTVGEVTVGDVRDATIEAEVISRFNVSGDVTRAAIAALPIGDAVAVGRLHVGGAFNGSTLVTLGDVGAIDVGAMQSSSIVAGVAADERGFHYLPSGTAAAPYDALTGVYRIESVNVRGHRRAGFAGSFIAAADVGTVYLSRVHGGATNAPFGVAAARLGRVRVGSGGNDAGGAFAVRQFTRPLAQSAGGLLYVGAGATTNHTGSAGNLTLIGGVMPTIGPDGVAIGTLRDAAGTSTLLLLPGGDYAVSTRGSLSHRTGDLAATLASIFGKRRVHLVTTTPGLRMIATSIGPDVRFFDGVLGRSYLAPAPAGDGGHNGNGTFTWTVPALASLRGALAAHGVRPNLIKSEPTLIPPGGGPVVGQVYDAAGGFAVTLADDGPFAFGNGAPASAFPFPEIRRQPRGGTRRLPVRVFESHGRLYFAGGPTGETVRVDRLPALALNSTGRLFKLPTWRSLVLSVGDRR